MISNERLSPELTELFFREIKLNIYIIFVMQSYFQEPKDENFKLMRASTFVICQSFNHLSDIGLEGFMNLYKTGIAKRYSFLVIDTLH